MFETDFMTICRQKNGQRLLSCMHVRNCINSVFYLVLMVLYVICLWSKSSMVCPVKIFSCKFSPFFSTVRDSKSNLRKNGKNIFKFVRKRSLLLKGSLYYPYKLPTKGRLISKGLFGVFNSSKKRTKKRKKFDLCSGRIVFVRLWKN